MGPHRFGLTQRARRASRVSVLLFAQRAQREKEHAEEKSLRLCEKTSAALRENLCGLCVKPLRKNLCGLCVKQLLEALPRAEFADGLFEFLHVVLAQDHGVHHRMCEIDPPFQSIALHMGQVHNMLTMYLEETHICQECECRHGAQPCGDEHRGLGLAAHEAHHQMHGLALAATGSCRGRCYRLQTQIDDIIGPKRVIAIVAYELQRDIAPRSLSVASHCQGDMVEKIYTKLTL